MSQEVDVAALRRLLADVSRKAEQAQAKVIATIDTKHVEFVAASDQVGDLRGGVDRLRGDLRRAAALLAGGESAAGGQDSSLVLRLRTAITEYTALKGELDALDATTLVLNRMLEVQRQFTELDMLTSSADYPEAAELTLEIAKALQSISAPDASAEPGMVRAAKAHYYQRRAALVQRLEEALGRRASFGERCALAQPGEPGAAAAAAGAAAATAVPAALPRLWGALGLLGLRERRAERLADEARQAVLWPMLEAARRLPRGQGLEAKISADRASGTITWTWVVGKDTGSDTENRTPQANSVAEPLGNEKKAKQRPSAQVVLPVLESFFSFAREHFAGNSGGVYEVLGKRLWAPLSSFLIRHFDTCECDGGVAVERFELSMHSRGLIGGREKTLARHVHDHRHAFGEQRRASMLAEVRGWLLQDDASLVQVSDAEEPGSVSQILEQTDARPPGGGAAEAELVAAPREAGGLSERLRGALRDDAGFLRVPAMRVSGSVRRLAGRVRELVDETAAAIGEGRAEGARDLNRLAREVCVLFSVLRPHVQKGQLKSSPQCCAVFFADCLYLVHVLLLVPYTHGKSLPAEHRQLALFVDLVPQIRRLGEHHFLSMLRHQQEQLVAALRPCDFGAGIAQDRRYIAAEAALGAAVQQVKAAAQGLAGVLPAQLFREVTGLLLGVLCQSLLGKLFQLQRIEPDEVGCLSGLLTSALVGSRQIFSMLQSYGGDSIGSGNEPSISEDIPGWGALTLVADLLGSGFSRFLEQRTRLLKVLKKEEVLKLMHLSWQDEFLSPDEAWTALNNAE